MSWKVFLHLLNRKYDKYDDMFVADHIEPTVYHFVDKHEDDIGRIHIIDRCHNAGGLLDHMVYRTDLYGYARLQFGDKQKALELYLKNNNLRMLFKMKDYIRNRIGELSGYSQIVLQLFAFEEQLQIARQWFDKYDYNVKMKFLCLYLSETERDILTDLVLRLIQIYKLKSKDRADLFLLSLSSSNTRFINTFYDLYADEIGDIVRSTIFGQSNRLTLKAICVCYNYGLLTSKEVVEIYMYDDRFSIIGPFDDEDYDLITNIHIKEKVDERLFVEKSFELMFGRLYATKYCIKLLEKYDWLPSKPVELSCSHISYHSKVLVILDQRNAIDKSVIKELRRYNIDQFKIVLPILNDDEIEIKAKCTLALALVEGQRKDYSGSIIEFIEYLEHKNIGVNLQTIMEKVLQNDQLEDYLNYDSQLPTLESEGLYIKVLEWLINTKRISNIKRLANIAKDYRYVRITHFLYKILDPSGCYYI